MKKASLLFFILVFIHSFIYSQSFPNDTITIIGVGDIMLGTNFPSNAFLPPNDGRTILNPVKHILKNADITFGNLEGVLLTDPGTVKKCKDTTYCYAFKSPDHYINYLLESGFDILNIANNHTGDFGEIGRKNTIQILKEKKISFAGLTSHPYTIFTKDSITYGFCGFAPNTGTVRITNYTVAKQIISHLDSVCDIVIVSFHGGAEGSKYKNITRNTEEYIGEDRGNPYEFSRIAIDAGADIVFGHGPHVTRAIDLYKNKFIAYSLGNFATYGRFNLTGPLGLAPIIKVYTDKSGNFLKAEITSIKQPGEGGPVLDKNNGALKEIILLTQQDIPEAPIKISSSGVVIKK